MGKDLPFEAQKGVYCFGGGKALNTIDFCLRKMGLLDHILAVVDNDERKWGTEKRIYEKSVPVISPLALRNKIQDGIILITCKDEKNVRAQLSSYPELRSTPIFSYRENVLGWLSRQAEQLTFPKGLRSTTEQLIPPVVHDCWFGGAPIPDTFQRYIDGWHRLCPDYEIKRWDESNYDVTKNRYMQEAYEAKKWGFVSDYARLDIIYEHGGIYLDTDVELVKCLDELRYNKAFCGVDYSCRVSSGLGFGAVAHHPAIQMLRDDYENQVFHDFSTRSEQQKHTKLAPELQSDILMKKGLKRNCLLTQDICDMRIYSLPVLAGIIGPHKVVTPFTYALHHYAGTWVPKK